MLPMHGGYGYGKRGRGGGTNPLLITVVVLAVLTALFGLGAWSAHSKSAKLQKELKTLRGAQSHSEDQLTHQRSLYQHLEYEYHTLQRRVNDMTREMQSKDHMLQLRSQEKDACTNSENILQQVAKELQEQVNYERAIVEVHKQKLTQLESAHRQREADWQALSKTWAKFETDATKENTRLLLELAKATQNNGTQAAPTQSPSPHQLPDPEPRTRPESAFNTQVELPKEEDFVHHMKAAEEYIKAQQLKMQQQQHGGNGAQPQQHQPAGQQHSATTIPPLEGMGHQENVGGGHAQQNQQGQQAHGMQGGGHREGVGRHLAADHGSHDDHYGHNDHKAPEDWHAHHGHHYEDDPNAWFDPDHLDPLDRYWINDDFNKDAWENHHQHDEHNTHHDAAHVNGHTPTPKNHDSHHQQPQQQYHPSQYEHQPTQHQQHQGQQHQPTQNQQHSGQGNQHGYQPVQQQQYHGNVAPEVHDWKQQQQGNGHQVPQNQAPHQQHGGHGSVPQPVPQHNPHLLPRHTGGAPQPQQHQQGGNNYSPHPHA